MYLQYPQGVFLVPPKYSGLQDYCGPYWHLSTQKETVQEWGSGHPFSVEQSSQEWIQQSKDFLPFASHSKSQFSFKETISTLGRSGSPCGLEASCSTIPDIAHKSFIGLDSKVPQGPTLSHPTQKSKAVATYQIIE